MAPHANDTCVLRNSAHESPLTECVVCCTLTQNLSVNIFSVFSPLPTGWKLETLYQCHESVIVGINTQRKHVIAIFEDSPSFLSIGKKSETVRPVSNLQSQLDMKWNDNNIGCLISDR